VRLPEGYILRSFIEFVSRKKSVTPPANIPQGTYTVCVSNGLGSWPLAPMPCTEPIIIRSKGEDRFHLGVPWAADLKFANNIYNVVNDPRLEIHASGDEVNDEGIPAMLGTIFQSNQVSHCGAQAYLLNGGAYQTTIIDGWSEGNPMFKTDQAKYWNTAGTHASIGTLSIGSGKTPPR
jgi:hypothetical protein